MEVKNGIIIDGVLHEFCDGHVQSAHYEMNAIID